jgi:hypothetical protein
MFIGAAGTFAAINTIEARAAALHIARAEVHLELAQAKLGGLAPEFAKATALAEKGGLTDRELRQVEARVARAESDVSIRELDLAETRMTGEPPNDTLSAPQVRGRDFVTERLVERRRTMGLRLELVADRARRYQELANSALASAAELKALLVPELRTRAVYKTESLAPVPHECSVLLVSVRPAV